MKKTLLISLMALIVFLPLTAESPDKKAPKETPKTALKTALIIIDVQDFYFPGGGYDLVNPEPAAKNAALLLKHFRQNKQLVVHVRHNAKTNANIHKLVQPLKTEKVISKNEVSCFKNTDLLDYLQKNKIKRLIICGMQTHMCVEAAVRAGSDHGFKCILIHDACATRDLKFQNKTVKAADVHNSTLSTLNRSYSKVIDTKAFLKEL